MPGTRVLIVDDEEAFVEALASRLDVRGMKVDTAMNGEQAVEKAIHKRFDAVVLDLAMPGMDGIDTLRVMKGHNPDLQIIILSGHATLKKGVEAMRLGALDILEKPVDIELLAGKIREARNTSDDLKVAKAEASISEIMKKKGW
jgi:DNA-binding NtrC family response regulator